VSRKIIWTPSSVKIPVTRCHVVWGLGVTIESFSPTSAFRSVDLPALGWPTSAT
jgi:hypothetical protein